MQTPPNIPRVPIAAGTSAGRGFLPPIRPGFFGFSFDLLTTIDNGQPLDDFLQQLVAGITLLNPTLVRPRWQPEPPNLPDWPVDWCAVGSVEHDPDPGWAYLFHDPDASEGVDALSQQEQFTLLTSFYGPHADSYDALLRDGIQLPQNNEVLLLAAIGLVAQETAVVVPELIKNRWWPRVDRRTRFHRALLRLYPVLTLLSVEVQGSLRGVNPLEFRTTATFPVPE